MQALNFSAIVAFPILFATFFYLKPPSPNASDASQSAQAYIPAQLLPPDVNPLSALVDPNGAIFHSGIMAVTLTILLGTSFVGGGKVRVWTVTAPAGIIALVRDLWSERKVAKVVQHVEEGIELDSFSIRQGRPPATPDPHLSLPFFARKFTKRFPTTSATISRLPLSLLPFAGGIFILSRALTSLGWTSIFAHWLAKICINPSAAVFFLGFIFSPTISGLLSLRSTD
jgi:Na+/H+ antiporter NhaD/arsenite permease-like protein